MSDEQDNPASPHNELPEGATPSVCKPKNLQLSPAGFDSASMSLHAAPQDAVDGGDLVEKVARAISPYIDNEETIDAVKLEAAEEVLAAIPSLSFDEAVEKVIASGNFVGTGLMIKAALKALTANGDVLIRSESTFESLAQSAKEQAE